jgi:transposase
MYHFVERQLVVTPLQAKLNPELIRLLKEQYPIIPTQREIAHEVGLSFSTVNRWLRIHESRKELVAIGKGKGRRYYLTPKIIDPMQKALSLPEDPASLLILGSNQQKKMNMMMAKHQRLRLEYWKRRDEVFGRLVDIEPAETWLEVRKSHPRRQLRRTRHKGIHSFSTE